MTFNNINSLDIEMGNDALLDAKDRNKKWYDAVIETEMLILVFAESENNIENAESAWLMFSREKITDDISNIDFMVITHSMVNELGIDVVKEQIKDKKVALVDWY